MPAPTLAELLTPVPLADWKARIIAVANAVGLETENWSELGYTRTLVALFAQLYTTGGDVVRIMAAGGLLDFAEGRWLTLLAKNVFQPVERIEATYASAVEGIRLTNTGGGLYTFEPRDLVFAHQDTHKTYRNTTGGTLSAGAGSTLFLDLEAEESGSDSSANANKITQLITTELEITVTNPIALVGLDEESDPDLRDRCRASVAALSIGGVKKAYEFYAKSAKSTSGTSLGVTRVRVMPAIGDGNVDVYIAGAGGAITGPNVALVQADFDTKVNPYGFSSTAISATNKSITAPCTIWLPSSLGLSQSAARQKVWDALSAYITTAPIGGVIISPATGKIYWRKLLEVVSGAIPGTLKAQLTSESDISIAVSEVPIWGGDLTDTTVNQVT